MFRLIKKLLCRKKSNNSYLKYSFIDNAILLRMEVVEKNGFHEVWRQENKNHSVQILCFNEETGEFKAFDRYQWMTELRGEYSIGDMFLDESTCFKEEYHDTPIDLWTPIQLHFTEEWLRKHLISTTWKL